MALADRVSTNLEAPTAEALERLTGTKDLDSLLDPLRIAHRVAVTPLIAGQAVKGPTVAMMRWAGLAPTALSVARLYSDFLDTFILDERDAALRPDIEALGLRVHVTDTLMTTAEDKARLAGEILALV